MTYITYGLIITIISVIGVVGCLTALIATKRIFKEQRKKLLEKIESE